MARESIFVYHLNGTMIEVDLNDLFNTTLFAMLPKLFIRLARARLRKPCSISDAATAGKGVSHCIVYYLQIAITDPFYIPA